MKAQLQLRRDAKDEGMTQDLSMETSSDEPCDVDGLLTCLLHPKALI